MSEYIGLYTISLTKRVPDMTRDAEVQARHFFEEEKRRLENLLNSNLTTHCSVDMQMFILSGKEPEAELPEEVTDCEECRIVTEASSE